MTFENAALAAFVEVETRLQGLKVLLNGEEAKAGRRDWTFKNSENEMKGEPGQKLAQCVTSKENALKTERSGVFRNREVLGNKYFDLRKD